MGNQVALVGVLAGTILLAACSSPPASLPSPVSTRQHSEASFEKLRQKEEQHKEASQAGSLFDFVL